MSLPAMATGMTSLPVVSFGMTAFGSHFTSMEERMSFSPKATRVSEKETSEALISSYFTSFSSLAFQAASSALPWASSAQAPEVPLPDLRTVTVWAAAWTETSTTGSS